MYMNEIKTEIFSQEVLRGLPRKTVAVEDCWRRYEGKIKNKGESITFLIAGKPTVEEDTKLNGAHSGVNIEEVTNGNITMTVNRMFKYGFRLFDVDVKESAIKGMEAIYAEEATEQISSKIDAAILKVRALQSPILTSAAAGLTINKDNILTNLDQMKIELWGKDVATSTEIVATISTQMYLPFITAYREFDKHTTTETLKNGLVAVYSGLKVKMSNNVYKDASGSAGENGYITACTRRAQGFASPYAHTEKSRARDKESKPMFATDFFGYTLADTKILRPEETVSAPVKTIAIA